MADADSVPDPDGNGGVVTLSTSQAAPTTLTLPGRFAGAFAS